MLVVFRETLTLKLSRLSERERVDLAYRTTVPKILLVLSADADVVRECVADNPNTPADILTVLSSDVDAVRECVADNPNTPADILIVLSADVDDRIRKIVASNPNTPVSALTVLATDVADATRWRTARNFVAPNELLWCLLADVYENVTCSATTRLQSQGLSLTDPSWVNPVMLRTIYDVLQTNNCLNTSVLIQLLKVKVVLSQSELIDLCELYSSDIHGVVETNYEITHPLLEKILVPSRKRRSALGVVVGR